ncbi:TonB-dependent siderophore receptor [Pedobacter metabolipauper]|uniref:Iron complex outermembrane receptor protein n=1 Tax=Pedobacter metabolipauper TaxID=425513 RepID=A0A4R6T0R5_9SPHI|nr:TonB-dependent siderophore receptor [Pedobacter metabolipauper]TDQ11070.1 iron complex outermembrane receptor protein [Pedobacter metabolipauper]
MYKACTPKKKSVTILTLFCILLFCHFSTIAQQASVLDKTITLKLSGARIADALTAITEQSTVRFSYSSTQLDVERKVTVNFNNKPLKEALAELLGKQLKGLSVNGQLVTIQTSSAKGTIKGKVKTRDGKAGEFVTVGIKGGRAVQVDARGNYMLKDVEAGTYTLTASFVGLTPQQKDVKLTSGETVVLDFILSENNEQLQEVVINGGSTNKFSVKKTTTSAKMPLGNLENPQVYTTIPKALLNEQMVTEFSMSLKNSPGVYKIQGSRGINSDGASFYSMRGFRTEAALMDGVPSQTNGEIEPANIERVELIKGPSGTLFGGAVVSFGGLINIVTKKPVDTLGGEIAYTTGSYNLNRLTADVYGPLSTDKKLLFRMNAAYQNQNSFQDVGFKKSTFISPAIEYRANERLNISLNAGFYELQGTSPAAVFLNRVRPYIATTPQELNFDWNRSYSSNDLVMKNPTVNVKGQINYKISDNWTSQTIYSSNTRKSDGFYQYQFIRGAASDEMLERNISLQNSVNTSTDIQQNFIGDFKVLGLRNRLVAGLDYLNQTVNNSNSPYLVFDNVSGLVPDANYVKISRPAVEARLAASTALPTKNTGKNNIYSVYASDVLNLSDRLMAMLSLRVDRFQNKGLLNQNDMKLSGFYMQTAFSPKLGMVYQVLRDRLSVFGNYMNGFSNVAPVSQPEGSGASNTFKPQQANQFEGGAKLDMFDGKLSFTASYYDIKVTNMTRTEGVNVNNVNYNITVQNGTQESHGVEFELITNPVEGLNVIAGYSYNYSKLTKSTAALENRRPASAGPGNLFNSWASYTVPKGTYKGLGLGFGANFIGEHLTGNSAVTGVFILPSYLLVTTTAFYDTPRYRLGVKIDNLTDELYFTGQGVLTAQMPRTIAANVTIKF